MIKYTQEDFERKVSEKHGDKVDVSEFVYTDSFGRGKCTCRVCGHVWHPRANTLMRGVGCRKCFDKRLSKSKKIDLTDIQRRIDESGSNCTIIGEYIDTKHKCLVRCNKCGYEWHTKAQELTRGHGCPVCGKKRARPKKEKDVEYFLTKVKERWGDAYLYDRVEETYTGWSGTVELGCPKHGYFTIEPKKCFIACKRICPECRKEAHKEKQKRNRLSQNERKKELRKKLRNDTEVQKQRAAANAERKEIRKKKFAEEFIERLKVIYKDEPYDFSKSKYANGKTKITVTCTKHGDFEKTPYSLLRGMKCPLCARTGKRYTTEEWVLLAKDKHPEFGYEHTNYVNKSVPVIVTCPTHGDIKVMPNAFLRCDGNPCVKCGDEERRKERHDLQLKKIKMTYADKPYTIVDDNFKNAQDKITVYCNRHNCYFRPTVNNILSSGCGCTKCGNEVGSSKTALSKEELVRRLVEIFGDEYNFSHISEMNKIRNETPITLVCKEHGEFVKTPHGLLAGKGCPECAKIRGGMVRRISQDEFIERVTKIHLGKELDFSKTVYVKGDDYVDVICHHKDANGNEHGVFSVKASALLAGNGCPKCNMSHLEGEVMSNLIQNEIEYISQCNRKTFEWLGYQSFDFYLPDYNIAIECQGGQHFIIILSEYR